MFVVPDRHWKSTNSLHGIHDEYRIIERQRCNLSTPDEKIDKYLNFDEKFQERPTLITIDDVENSIDEPGHLALN